MVVAKRKKADRLRKYVVWLSNHTDRRDDDTMLVKARSREEALETAKFIASSNFSPSDAWTLPEFKERDPEWYGWIKGHKARNE